MKTKGTAIKLRSSVLALVAFITLGMITARNSAGLPGIPAAPAVDMKISICCQCQDRNSVGNEWDQVFSIDDAAVQNGGLITLNAGQGITLYTEIVEHDDVYDDVAADSFLIEITAENLLNGFFVIRTLEVKENAGRYKGNIAVWTVIYTFTPQ